MVMDFDFDPNAFKRQHHRGAYILGMVIGRNGKISLLVARAMAQVRIIRRSLSAGIPKGRLRIKVVEPIVVALIETDIIEDEELKLRTDIDGVGDADLFDVLFGLLRHITRIAGVIAASYRIFNIADQHQRRMLSKWIYLRRSGIREQQHVRLIDRLESADRGSIEANAFSEKVLGQFAGRNREMLPRPRQVNEPQIYDLDPLLFSSLNYFFWGHSLPPYQAPGHCQGLKSKLVFEIILMISDGTARLFKRFCKQVFCQSQSHNNKPD